MADFNKELKECTGAKSIILGNGFGISYDIAVDEENFNWSTLLDLCEIKEGSTIHCLLSECYYDFELAHQKINNAIEVISLYQPQSELVQELKSQIQYLREQLVVAVSNSHGNPPTKPAHF